MSTFGLFFSSRRTTESLGRGGRAVSQAFQPFDSFDGSTNQGEQLRQQADTEKDELYKQIGQLKVELDFLKKRAGLID